MVVMQAATAVQAGETTCYINIPNVASKMGTYSVTLTASGFAERSLDIAVASGPSTDCCSCGFTQVMTTAQLSRLP